MTPRRILDHRGELILSGKFIHEDVWIFLDPSEKGNLGTDTV